MDSVVDREFQFLNENVRSGSSSEEKLSSTPGSSLDRTPGSSLERGLDPRTVVEARSRSSSRERSLSESSPLKTSSEMKTPDTDLSDASLPLPPPPPPDQLEKMMEDGKDRAPFRHHLRKTKAGERIRKSTDLEEGSRLEHEASTTLGSLEETNVRNVISRYGTIPKGARIGAFLASLEQNSEDCGVNPNNTEHTFISPSKENGNSDSVQEEIHVPTPEVTRKVEEWKAGVERSMAENKTKDGSKDSDKDSGNSTEHNVKPSAILRSSSSHTMTVGPPADTKPALSAFFQRQKSDLTSPGAASTTAPGSSPCSEQQPPQPQQSHGSPVPEWKRAKPKPSPRVQPRRPRPAWEASDGPKASAEGKLEKTVISATVNIFPPRNPSSSSEEVVLENKSLETKSKVDSSKSTGVDYASTDCLLRNKLSPPVPKKPGLSHSVDNGSIKKDKITVDSVQKKSPDSVIEGITKGRNKALWEKSSPVGKLDFSVQLRPTLPATTGAGHGETNSKLTTTSSSKSKFPFLKQDSADRKDKSKSQAKDEGKSVDVCSTSPGAPKSYLPPGARPVLPGSKQVLPSLSNSSAPSSNTPQRTQRVSLQRVNSDKERPAPEEPGEPPSKDQLKELSKKLSSSLEALNSTASKHTSNFMHLSEEVQGFYDACSGYVESLPPHGKFHFRELLTTLQGLAENLKTCSGSNVKEYDKLLGRLQSTIKDIDTKLSR